MMLQAVHRIVGRAHQYHVHLAHDPATGKVVLGQLRVARLPDAFGRVGTEQAIADAKRPPEFEMGPVIKGIAERLGHDLGPLLELLPVGRVAGAVTLLDAGRTHRPPLVVVSVKPRLRKVLEPVVFGDLPRRQMTMVVDDRHVPRVLVVQLYCPVTQQQEVFRDEGLLLSHAVPFLSHAVPFPWRLRC